MFRVQQIPENPDFMWITPEETFPVSEFLGNDWRPSKCVFPPKYLLHANRIYNFEVRPDDIWVISFPKCGTTWTQEMTWLIQNNFDYETARTVKLDTRSIFLEWCATSKDVYIDTITEAANLKSPRLIKSHLPISFLPKQLWTVKPKIIYAARNVKDAIISLYHFFNVMMGEDTNFDEFLNLFMNDSILWTPFWTHVLEFWKIRNDANVLFLNYEEMYYDLKSVIRKCCEFLEKPYSEDDVDKLSDHLSFDNMKSNPSCNYDYLINEKLQKYGKNTNYKFMRKGKVGSYKEELSEDYIKKIDEWSSGILKDTKLNFKY